MKFCYICGSKPTMINKDEVRCSNKACRLHNQITKINTWNEWNKNSVDELYHVEYLSPGTFFAESSNVEISAHSIADMLKKAVQKSKAITERYDSKPYGFSVNNKMYFLSHNKITALKNIEICPSNKVLLHNITQQENTGAVAISTVGWLSTQPFGKNAYLLDEGGNIVDKGSNYKVDNKKLYDLYINHAISYSHGPTHEKKIAFEKAMKEVYL